MEPKHREISRYLTAAISSGKYKAGDRLPSEAQLIAQFSVSRPTVARALLDLQVEGHIERRAGSGSYVRKGAEASLITRQLALLIPGLGTTEIFEIICGELASLARVGEYTVLWGGSTHPREDQDSSREHALELCGQFLARRVSGVFFAPFELLPGKEEINQRIAEQFREAGIPVILLDRDFTAYPYRSNFDLVGLDNIAAGYLLAEHLIKLGCQRLAFVAKPLSAATVDARIDGVRNALARHNIEPSGHWIHLGDPEDPKFIQSLLAGHLWDAFICANDITAAHLITAFEQKRCRVPQDVRVVGVDDAKYATLIRVPLTTVQQPCRDIAVTAFHAMIERIAEPTLPPRSLLLTPHLVVRESCGAYLPRSKPDDTPKH
jgi:DNA-binding LacI/PurR family transcriptional regulator